MIVYELRFEPINPALFKAEKLDKVEMVLQKGDVYYVVLNEDLTVAEREKAKELLQRKQLQVRKFIIEDLRELLE